MKFNQIPQNACKLSAPYRQLADLFDLLAHQNFVLGQDYGFYGGDCNSWFLAPNAVEQLQKDKHVYWFNVLYSTAISWQYRKWENPVNGAGIDLKLNM